MIARPFHCQTCTTIPEGRLFRILLTATIRLWICRSCLAAWRGM